MEEVKIVEARKDHAGFLAWVILEAGRSHMPKSMWDFLVGGTEEECLNFLEALTLTGPPHWAYYSLFVVAEMGGKPVSALCGYTQEEHGTGNLLQAMTEANKAVGRTEGDNVAGWTRAGSIALVAPEHEPGVWIVENVATLPEYRRRHLVDRLLVEILDIGRSKGFTQSDIGVFIGNDRAQRAYEKAGFQVIGDKCHPDFEAVYKCPGVRSMTRAL